MFRSPCGEPLPQAAHCKVVFDWPFQPSWSLVNCIWLFHFIIPVSVKLMMLLTAKCLSSTSLYLSSRETRCVSSLSHNHVNASEIMKIAPLGLAGGRSYDRTNSLRTPTMRKESQLLREKTTSSVFVSTCSNAVHAQFHWRNTRPCDVVCLHSKHFRSIAGIWSHHRRRSTRAIDRGETWNTSGKPHAVVCCTMPQWLLPVDPRPLACGMQYIPLTLAKPYTRLWGSTPVFAIKKWLG